MPEKKTRDLKRNFINCLNDHTDPELMLLWQEGNERAFETLYKRYIEQLLTLTMRKTGDRDIALEMVQEAFLKLYGTKEAAAEIRSVPAYLYVILKNQVLNHYRKESARRKYESYLSATFGDADHSTELSIMSRDLERQLEEEIERLPAKCREVFKLSRRENLSNKDIASRLGISENTVEQHVRRALRGIRSSLMFFLCWV